jgi:hypothetical protein
MEIQAKSMPVKLADLLLQQQLQHAEFQALPCSEL